MTSPTYLFYVYVHITGTNSPEYMIKKYYNHMTICTIEINRFIVVRLLAIWEVILLIYLLTYLTYFTS